MARITHCKNLQKDMLTKDLNFGIFLDTIGKITDTYQIEWPRVYSIFDNDGFFWYLRQPVGLPKNQGFWTSLYCC